MIREKARCEDQEKVKTTSMLVEEYKVGHSEIAGVPVICTTYKIGPTYFCVIAAVASSTTTTRSSGASRESALFSASQLAKRRFMGV